MLGPAGAGDSPGALALGEPESLSTRQVPPKLLKFWPLTSPLAWSAAKRYSGRPLSVTCNLPLLRCRMPTWPCTPAASLTFVLLEGTVTGGQNFRHSLSCPRGCFLVP